MESGLMMRRFKYQTMITILEAHRASPPTRAEPDLWQLEIAELLSPPALEHIDPKNPQKLTFPLQESEQ